MSRVAYLDRSLNQPPAWLFSHTFGNIAVIEKKSPLVTCEKVLQLNTTFRLLVFLQDHC